MNHIVPPDVQQLIAAQIASGNYANADDVLRDALRALVAIEDDTAATQAAIDDWKNGDEGLSLDAAFAAVRSEFRRKHPE